MLREKIKQLIEEHLGDGAAVIDLFLSYNVNYRDRGTVEAVPHGKSGKHKIFKMRKNSKGRYAMFRGYTTSPVDIKSIRFHLGNFKKKGILLSGEREIVSSVDGKFASDMTDEEKGTLLNVFLSARGRIRNGG